MKNTVHEECSDYYNDLINLKYLLKRMKPLNHRYLQNSSDEHQGFFNCSGYAEKNTPSE